MHKEIKVHKDDIIIKTAPECTLLEDTGFEAHMLNMEIDAIETASITCLWI